MMPITGYDKVGSVTIEGRALQARALLRCAIALNEALHSQDGEQMLVAVTNNSRLWLFFYSEIEQQNVTLPPEVASNILSLAAYVVKVTPRAMAGERAVVEAMISINRNIAAGLGEGSDATAEPPATVAASISGSF